MAIYQKYSTKFIVYNGKNDKIGIYDNIRSAAIDAWYTYIRYFLSRIHIMYFFMDKRSVKFPKPDLISFPDIFIEKWVNNKHTLTWSLDIAYNTLCNMGQKRMLYRKMLAWKYELLECNNVPDDLWNKYMFLHRCQL